MHPFWQFVIGATFLGLIILSPFLAAFIRRRGLVNRERGQDSGPGEPANAPATQAHPQPEGDRRRHAFGGGFPPPGSSG